MAASNEQPEPEDDQKTLELEWRIQELERRAEEERKAKETADEQLRLMEKSYEMASRYLPQEGGGAKSVPVTETKGRTVSPVTQVAEQVVSMLAQPMSDAEFMERYSRPHNMGFHTVTDQAHTAGRNSIRACIRRTVTVSDGKEAEIRLLEPIDVGGMYIPANTVLTATARINGERMELTVSSIAYKGTVVPVELEVYDPSGMKGISVPGSQELTALKEMAANMGFHDGQQHQHLHQCRGATGLGLGTRRDTGAVAIPRHEVPHRQGNAQGEPRGTARGKEITLCITIIHKEE